MANYWKMLLYAWSTSNMINISSKFPFHKKIPHGSSFPMGQTSLVPPIGFVKIFHFRFLMDLHVLECPEHDLTISGSCLSVCVWQKFYGKCSSRTNAQNFMKFYNQFYPNINWCLSAFDKNRSIDGIVVKLFPEFLGSAYFSL